MHWAGNIGARRKQPFQGSTIEIAFPLYSTVLSGLATGAAEAPRPEDTQTTLI